MGVGSTDEIDAANPLPTHFFPFLLLSPFHHFLFLSQQDLLNSFLFLFLFYFLLHSLQLVGDGLLHLLLLLFLLRVSYFFLPKRLPLFLPELLLLDPLLFFQPLFVLFLLLQNVFP